MTSLYPHRELGSGGRYVGLHVGCGYLTWSSVDVPSSLFCSCSVVNQGYTQVFGMVHESLEFLHAIGWFEKWLVQVLEASVPVPSTLDDRSHSAAETEAADGVFLPGQQVFAVVSRHRI